MAGADVEKAPYRCNVAAAAADAERLPCCIVATAGADAKVSPTVTSNHCSRLACLCTRIRWVELYI